ncbi:hypothetical protein [Aminipila sp.]|uniref:hypothetical protein n=1 Tax=Aminipila sp. TaxID=2060095 RepID=UPI00289BE65B|nr:hypothetical protein [Aminipila sp.]
MKKYNISKYNPKFKDNQGRYLREDWTAISDIDKVYNGKIFSAEDYLKMEDNYIKTVYKILNFHNLKTLKVKDVKKSFTQEKFLKLIDKQNIAYSQHLLNFYNRIESVKNLEYQDIDSFCRLLLREDIGAKLFYPRKLKIFICYDYLLGIHSSSSIEKVIPKITDLGLFVEEFSD